MLARADGGRAVVAGHDVAADPLRLRSVFGATPASETRWRSPSRVTTMSLTSPGPPLTTRRSPTTRTVAADAGIAGLLAFPRYWLGVLAHTRQKGLADLLAPIVASPRGRQLGGYRRARRRATASSAGSRPAR